MKVTIYELLGMVKDGKAPKKIKYINKFFDYDSADYFNTDIGYLFERCTLCVILNDEVEILEEEKKIPEKITMRAGLVGDINNKIENLDINIMIVEDKLNEIIDYLKSKGDE